MFRRRWSGLPKDPSFPSDLEKLGYFVNDQDEIRSIADPNCYFKYFLTRNERYNDRQRFAFNDAVLGIIHARLEAEGLRKVFLPLGEEGGGTGQDAAAPAPRVPVFVSANVAAASRVVVLFGETNQELGVLAHRVASGPGGVDQGSVVPAARALLRGQRCSAADPAPPAVVVANPGGLWWWPEGGRALSMRMFQAAPMRSAVHAGRFYDPAAHAVPRAETPAEHVAYVLGEAVPRLARPGARVDVVGVGDAAELVEAYLDGEAAWAALGPRLNSLAIVGGFFDVQDARCDGFREFLKKRARAYILADEPLGLPLAGPEGNPNTGLFTGYGCPVFSGGEKYLSEMLLVRAQAAVLPWIQEVALADDYANPEVAVTYREEPGGEGPRGQVPAPGDGQLEILTAEEFERRQRAGFEAASAA